MIKLKGLLTELSYADNLGVMELVDFYDSASPAQLRQLQKLADAKQWKAAWDLVQKVTKTKLMKMGEDQDIDPENVDVDAILNPNTDDSFERSRKWAGSMEIT